MISPKICHWQVRETMVEFQFESESKDRRRPVSQLEDHQAVRVNSLLLNPYSLGDPTSWTRPTYIEEGILFYSVH